MSIRQCKFIICFFVCLSLFPSWLKADETIQIGQHEIRLGLLKQLHALEQQKIGLRDFINTVEEQVLMADYHDKSVELNLWRQTNTGFAPDLTLTNSLHRTLQALFPEPVSKSWRGSLEAKIQTQIPSKSVLSTWFAENDILGYDLTEEQSDVLSKYVLLTFPANSNKPDVTMASLYNAQSVQGRMRLRQTESGYLQTLVEKEKFKFVFSQWLIQQKLLSEYELQVVRSLVYARLLHPKLLAHLGVEVDQHGDNTKRREFAQAVTDREIASYYELNKKQFIRLEQISADFWLFDSHEKAKVGKRTLSQSSGFPVKPEQLDIDMRNLARLGKAKKWIANLAAALPTKTFSQVVRMPTGKWIVIKVKDKKYGVFPLDSETVRYQARNQLAIRKAQASYESIRRDLGLPNRSGTKNTNQNQFHSHKH